MSSSAPYVVAICVPVADKITVQFWRSVKELTSPSSWPGGIPGRTHYVDCHGLPVEAARRTLTHGALTSIPDLTHILWVDDDMAFPAHALRQLLEHDKDIVGGLCHNRRAPSYQPIAAKLYPPALELPQGTYGFAYDLPQSGLFEVDATGGAFLLVKAQVFRDISERSISHGGPEDVWWVPQGTASEDFSFCQRAKACGYSIFIDCGLDIGHVAEVVVNREVAHKLRTVEWAKWLPLMTPQDGKKPVASIIVPTYNQKPKYLKAAVLSALNQTVPVEVIVVDDGTTDYELRCEEVMQPPREYKDGEIRPEQCEPHRVVWISKRCKLLRHPTNRGISAALNTGIAAMSTDWFCWLSSDDMMDPTKVERQLSATLTAGAKASFHDYSVIDNTAGHFTRYVEGPTWRTLAEQNQQLRAGCCINGSTVMAHRDALYTATPFEKRDNEDAVEVTEVFDTNLRYAQDWEMWLRIGQQHLWHRVPEQLGLRREGENLTAQLASLPKDDTNRRRRDEEDQIVRRQYRTAEYELAELVRHELGTVEESVTAEEKREAIKSATELLRKLMERLA